MRSIKKENGNGAFTKTGLKVVFHLLLDKDLVNKPHRLIAKETGVGLGDIPQVINGLKETGYLSTLYKEHYIWGKREELLCRWIKEYETTLNSTFQKREYQLQSYWQEIDFISELTVWGGEPASAILVHNLRPEIFTIYTKENELNLINNYKLKPVEKGDVKVYDMFWQKSGIERIAPPLLVYADLILSNNKRCLEAAQLIYNEYIKSDI